MANRIHRPDLGTWPLGGQGAQYAGTDHPSLDVQPFMDALNSEGERADAAWRKWAHESLSERRFSPATAEAIWEAVVTFDEALAEYLVNPVPTPQDCVIVSGSGKETFKTFNVSTAASLLAAAAGVNVVKGTSSSVSAVSGSSDVLAALGVPSLTSPDRVPHSLSEYGIAFINYRSFCPRYADRYDGRFDFLSPMGFFMPAATLAVRSDAFLHGLAHEDVQTAALGIHAARPEIPRGRVVTTSIGAHQRIDEIAPVGAISSARLKHGAVDTDYKRQNDASSTWLRAVRHHEDHHANAATLVDSLRPDGTPEIVDLAERNATAILSEAYAGLDDEEAFRMVREARLSGQTIRLLSRLRSAYTKDLL